MGSWDCYCAICAGPMSRVHIRGHTGYIARPNAGPRTVKETKEDDDDGKSVKSDDSSEKEGVGGYNDEEEEEEEEDGYDPRVLELADVDWIENCRVLGFNSDCTRVNKAFISGQGSYDDYGSMSCDAGDDPNCQGVNIRAFSCYHDFNNGDPVFPFHMDCLKVLCRYLTGSDDISALDKDVMYGVMRSLAPDYCSSLNVDYSANETNFFIQNEQFWSCNSGEEMFVVSPLRMAPLTTAEVEMLQRGTNMTSLDQTLGYKVKADPFSNLPLEIMHQITKDLDYKSLMGLFRASWALHSAHHNNHNFWMKKIRDDMAWFFELHDFLQSPSLSENIASAKAIYLWAHLKSKPRRRRRGKYMGIANRRRIWSVCGQLAEDYRSKLAVTTNDTDETIRDNAVSLQSCIISWPVAPSDQTLVKSFWISSWDDLYYPKTVDTFWDSQGFLVGLAANINGQRKLFGFDNQRHDIQMRSLQMQNYSWITGIILHIPPVDPLAPSWSPKYARPPITSTAPRGIVFSTSAGVELSVGETDVGHCQRSLLPPPGQTIVGVGGHIGIVNNRSRILRLGLLLCPQPPANSLMPPPEVSKPPLEQSFLWTNSAYKIQGRPFWRDEKLRVRTFEGGLALQSGGSWFHHDIVPHEAFLWAQSSEQLCALKKLTIYSVKTGTKKINDMADNVEVLRAIGNMRADFTTSSGLDPVFARSAETNGRQIPEDFVETFDIDGPGGERIIELSARMGLHLDALKLRTNRGREFLWRAESEVGDGWKFITVPDGHEALAGLVVAFSDSFRYDYVSDDNAPRNTRLDYLAVVTIKCEE